MVSRTTKLKVEREARGWNKSQVARKAQIGESRYGKIESGREYPYAPEITRIAEVFDWKGNAFELVEDVDSDG